MTMAPNDPASQLFDLLAGEAEERALRRGEVLIRAGEPADELHFVLSGRLSVHVAGSARPVAEVAQGEPVGEIGFFAGLARTATVVALRDTTVLTIRRVQFQTLSRSSPGLLEAIVASLARRLAGGVRREPVDQVAAIRTLAIVPAGASPPSARFVDRLRGVFAASGPTRFLTEDDLKREVPGACVDDARASHWLNSLETELASVVYVADPTLTGWTEKCIRQADAVLLVAAAGAPAVINPSEALALSLLAPPARRLVIVHETRSDVVRGTDAWLGGREAHMHHHVALGDDEDVRRLHRFITGSATGFVAGAGGALGSAHVGAYKAFAEAGARFDILGGTSVGAAMMAAFACGAEPGRVDEGTDNIFVRSRSFRRPTLPRYGLIDHKNFDRALRAEYRDRAIEDLWIPFFAVSTNLSTGEPMVHRRGPVWQAVRASGSIPGLLPPFFTSEGEMLVDGAVMDAIPLGVMKRLKSGPNVVSSLAVDRRRTYAVDYDAIPGPRELAAALINPFARARLPQVPGMLQVLLLSMLANRRSGEPAAATDIVFRPELAADIGMTSWERHTEIFTEVHRQAARWIRDRLAAGDQALAALVR
jgi:NTE family protein